MDVTRENASRDGSRGVSVSAARDAPEGVEGSFRLRVLALHPIQYQAPLWRALATDRRVSDFAVWFGWKGAAARETYDHEFAASFSWDMDLLRGYRSVVMRRLGTNAARGGILSRVNCGVAVRLMKERPDAVMVMGHGTVTAIATLAICRMLRIPTLLYGDYSEPRRRWLTPLRHLVVRMATIGGVIGEKNRRLYVEASLPEARLVRVPFGVDNAHFESEQPIENDTCSERPSVVVVGKMVQWKNHELLLRALASLSPRERPLLRFVGSGPLEGHLRRLAKDVAVEREVEWRGFVNYSGMPAEYRRSTAACLPSTREAWGLAINEAMASHRAAIVSDACGCAQELVVPGETGVIFPSGEIEPLAAALRSVAREPILWREMGRKAGEHISYYDVQVAAATIVKALREASTGTLSV